MGMVRTAAEQPPFVPFRDHGRDRNGKRDAVLRTAASLFLELGYRGTRLDDVAKRLKITKPALYNYFQNKEEILFECYRLGIEMTLEGLRSSALRHGTGLERLRVAFHAYVIVMAQPFGMCLARVDDLELSEDARARVRKDKRKLDRRFRGLVEEGIRDGSIAPCDPKLAAFTLAGSANWISHWYRPEGKWNPEALGDRMCEQLFEGLAARKRAPVTPRAVAQRVRKKVAP